MNRSENIPISQQQENLRNALRSRAEFDAECSSPHRRRVPPPRPETPTPSSSSSERARAALRRAQREVREVEIHGSPRRRRNLAGMGNFSGQPIPNNSSTETPDRIPLAPITVNLLPTPPSTQMVIGPSHQIQPFVMAPTPAPSRRSQAQISRRLREAQAQALLTPPVTQATTPTQAESNVNQNRRSEGQRRRREREAQPQGMPSPGSAAL
ncbi:hypothetical protein D9613_000889 [Agrocybe pediades]|uniref:Uncharacterized protein n=1 Tax=Agrocybe pediades TaxID=84607 RepID=A0A8H4VVH2_9AGAR|nr:hypothetical protein D9613_000889 [Agrocybe pediades]